MIYTDEQFQALAAYEERFRIAIEQRYARNPGREALRVIHAHYCAATGANSPLYTNCASCIMGLLTNAGRLYFADKAEREKPKKAVSLSTEDAPKVKAKVATKKSNKAPRKAAK